MQPREKLLASIVGGMVLLVVAYGLYGKVSRAFSERYERITVLKGEIREKKASEARGMQAAARMSDWEERSLPPNLKLAGTLYQNWLTGLADKVKLANVNIDSARATSHKKIYDKLPFTLQCRGTLAQATAFMHQFYSANHLHQIREMGIKPNDNGKDLELTFTIEALSLPTATHTDRLNDTVSARLVAKTVDDYNSTIVKRNLFATYTPPAPPRPPVAARPPDPPKPKPPGFNAAKFAVLTAILEADEGTQAWFSLRTTGEVQKLYEGDKVKVGEFQGTIVHIGVADVEIESSGKRRLLLLGKNLTESLELAADEPPTTAEPTTTSPSDDKEKEDSKPAVPAIKPEATPDDS